MAFKVHCKFKSKESTIQIPVQRLLLFILRQNRLTQMLRHGCDPSLNDEAEILHNWVPTLYGRKKNSPCRQDIWSREREKGTGDFPVLLLCDPSVGWLSWKSDDNTIASILVDVQKTGKQLEWVGEGEVEPACCALGAYSSLHRSIWPKIVMKWWNLYVQDTAWAWQLSTSDP